MARFSVLLMIVSLALAGCSGSGESPGQETSGELESTTSVPPSSAPSAPTGEAVAEAAKSDDKAPAQATKRSSTEGRWLIVVCNYREAVDFPAMLVEITKEGEKFTPKLLESQFLPGNPKLTSSEIKSDSVHLVFEVASDNVLDLSVRLSTAISPEP